MLNGTPEPSRPLPPAAPLKAERIQAKLRAERIARELAVGAERTGLGPAHVEERLRAVPGWRLAPGASALERSYLFPSYTAAAAFVRLLAEIGTVSGFMPTTRLAGLAVEVVVATAEGMLTEVDFELAQLIDSHL